jgi:hypothetical protein
VEILAATRGLDFGRFDTAGRHEPRNQGYAFNWARSDATTEDMIRTGQHTALVTLPDIRHLPEFAEPLRSGRLPATLADAFTVAIGRYNAQLRAFAANDPRIALIDLDRTTRAANLVSQDSVLVAGRRLDRRRPANALDCLFLADARHPGTLGQGLMACLFIEIVDRKFDAGITPLSPQEVLVFARSVQPPRDAVVESVTLAGASHPVAPAGPADGEGAEVQTQPRGR